MWTTMGVALTTSHNCANTCAELREWIHRIWSDTYIYIYIRIYIYTVSKISSITITLYRWRPDSPRSEVIHFQYQIPPPRRGCSFSGSWTHPFCSLCAGGYPWDLALPGVVLLFWRGSHFRIICNSDRICNILMHHIIYIYIIYLYIMNRCWILRIFSETEWNQIVN